MQNRRKGIIFDLDGTLWDSSEEVAIAWSGVLKRHFKLEISNEEMKSLMGKTMDDIFRRLLPPSTSNAQAMQIAAECCNAEQEYLRQHGARLFPHVPEVLEKLSRTYQLFIVSNCDKGYIETFLYYYKFEPLFSDTECFGHTGKQKGSSIRLLLGRNPLQKAVYVGDTHLDMAAAKFAGIPFIHADYGFEKVPEASCSISSFDELPKAVSEIL
ncbi:MAG TPA: HAD family hydrolase [Ruminococcaceae bacterium]|jgi:phosphoglycolate phosphatase|nr:HAD family hydrolase [Oscillospiraceae bacterium]